jgi:hypothetical protein
MKGIVFNVLEESVREDFGEDTWDALLEATEFDGVYTSLGTYDDAQLLALVGAASKALGKPPVEIVRWFGEKAAGNFARRYPVFFEPHTSTRTFLLTLNDIIHPEVRKLYPGADAPNFTFDDLPDGRMSIGYDSHRKLCAFAEGLIIGSARQFGEAVEIEQPECALRGDPACTLVLRFQKSGDAA